jgi:hypothetical protein
MRYPDGLFDEAEAPGTQDLLEDIVLLLVV